MFKYCEETTLNHPICCRYTLALELVTDIFCAEGCKRELFDTECAINLDKVEEIKAKKESRSKNSTMDMSFGLSKTGKDCRMLLVELKLRVEESRNLRKSDIDAKIKYSRVLIGGEIKIHTEKIVLFNDNCIREARRNIARIQGNKPNMEIQAKSVTEFKSQYFEN